VNVRNIQTNYVTMPTAATVHHGPSRLTRCEHAVVSNIAGAIWCPL